MPPSAAETGGIGGSGGTTYFFLGKPPIRSPGFLLAPAESGDETGGFSLGFLRLPPGSPGSPDSRTVDRSPARRCSTDRSLSRMVRRLVRFPFSLLSRNPSPSTRFCHSP